MSSQSVTVFICVLAMFFLVFAPINRFIIWRRKRKLKSRVSKAYSSSFITANEAREAFSQLDADESTHPPVPLKVTKFGRDLNFIDDYEVGANKGLGPIYRRQPHRHKWVFVGRGTDDIRPWPQVYKFECIGDYYCQDTLRMDIEPMWGFVPDINPVVAGFNRTRYKMRAESLRMASRDWTTRHRFHATTENHPSITKP